MNLYALHDASQEWMPLIRDSGMTGWAVQSESIGADPNDHSGGNYAWLAAYGVTPLVRLNYSHHGEGSIPLPNRYDEFAARCANFVSASSGCAHWIIGNETNWADERPDGVVITPRQYADCFARCRHQIKQRGTLHQCIVAAVAPYNEQSGWCIDYWREMLGVIAMNGNGDPGADGLALHTYSRGSDPASIYSEDKMEAYPDCSNGFRAYRDFLVAVPAVMRGLPTFITETNQIDPWLDTNSGWVRNAYSEINDWNQTAGNQIIHCLALYRWENYDRWVIKGKNGVIDDFKAALALGYTVPDDVPPFEPEPPWEPEPDADYLVEWDPRLDERGTQLAVVASNAPTEWHVRVGRWFDEQEAQGRVNVFVSVLDEDGDLLSNVPVRWFWQDGQEVKLTEIKHDPWLGHEYSLDFAMYNIAPAYSLQIDDEEPTDILSGLGLGDLENPHHTIHTCYEFVFQRIANKAETTPPITPPLMTQIEAGRVTATDGLNLRAQPNTQAQIYGTLAYRSTVLYDRAEAGWLHVVQGWVSGEYVGEVEDAPANSQQPTASSHLVHPLPGARITQHWGQPAPEYSPGMWGHAGVDFAIAKGTPIACLADGVVTHNAFDRDGYGHFIMVRHDAIRKETLYAHLDEPGAPVGTVLHAGQTLGKVGSSGNSTGPHCHVELRDLNADGSYKEGSPMPRGRLDIETWCFIHELVL